MKLIVCLMVMLIATKECDQNQARLSTNESTEIQNRMMQDSTKITYEATTRGFYLKLWITGDSISITQDRYLKDVSTYALSDVDKEAIYSMLNVIDETSLKDLMPPTTTFQYDAAAMATFEIATTDKSHLTPTFDHGKPPKPIAEIVNKMLSIRSEVEKQ
ncbi:hypothetical protein [Psychroserpens sp.]|uniref:hypothetical protein n=1 Tax=Psychroserpens sp. TaxID=2020870 RepID=UPI001B249025|nr:hypothetical protein [Psychroserpens sp.]MBO6605212.1 hypothetical protein [Psychroserpens sp.]MBO6630154.1 hypothetical protein [Psychroserpens sp.]MBO6653979.1 hypothetical protein [Psychroserpens sp.]MBO6682300.1 hypothetical protein [Psychroserpens sp.]MBO6748586.1 hypothetical protein [Psychroserpens sp.]